jgi:hypothetical protein
MGRHQDAAIFAAELIYWILSLVLHARRLQLDLLTAHPYLCCLNPVVQTGCGI